MQACFKTQVNMEKLSQGSNQAWAIDCCALCELPLYFDMGVVSAASPTDRVWDRVGCEEAEFLLADAAKSAGGRGHLSYAL